MGYAARRALAAELHWTAVLVVLFSVGMYYRGFGLDASGFEGRRLALMVALLHARWEAEGIAPSTLSRETARRCLRNPKKL